MEFKIPATYKIEHDELHEMLKKATQLSGKTGEAAKTVAQLLHPHFVKEEEFALPPLCLLPMIASGSITSEMKEVTQITEKLKEELPKMLAEHKEIMSALKVLIKCAKSDNHADVVQFAHKLMLHAQTEEEVTYPTSILIGEYIKLKSGAIF